MATWHSNERLAWTKGTPLVQSKDGTWGVATAAPVHAVVSGRIDEYTIALQSSGTVEFGQPVGTRGDALTLGDGTVYARWQSPTRLVLTLPTAAAATSVSGGGTTPTTPTDGSGDYVTNKQLNSMLEQLRVQVAAQIADIPAPVDPTRRIWFGA